MFSFPRLFCFPFRDITPKTKHRGSVERKRKTQTKPNPAFCAQTGTHTHTHTYVHGCAFREIAKYLSHHTQQAIEPAYPVCSLFGDAARHFRSSRLFLFAFFWIVIRSRHRGQHGITHGNERKTLFRRPYD